MKINYLYIVIILFLTSCGTVNTTKLDEQIRIMGDTIILPKNETILSKLNLYTTVNKAYNTHITTTGTVKTLSGCLAEISTPFDGRVVRLFVTLGQKVSAGTPIFEINSPQYSEILKLYIQAKQDKQLATNNFNRQNDLLANKIGSQKEFEDAESAFQLANKEYDKAVESLAVFDIRPSDVNIAKPLIIKSPIAGEVVQQNITTGQYLKADAAPVATIANINKVWVVAHLKEINMGAVNPKDEVEIFSEAYPDKTVGGTVNYICNLMDEQTRSVEVYIECENSAKMLKPGMFATVRFTQKQQNALVIPTTALLQEEEKNFVYIKLNDNTFVKRQVVGTLSGESDFVVHSGIVSGETLVSVGAVYLR